MFVYLDSERYGLEISVQIERLLKCVYSGYMVHGHNAVNEGIYDSFLYPTATMGLFIQAYRPSLYIKKFSFVEHVINLKSISIHAE